MPQGKSAPKRVVCELKCSRLLLYLRLGCTACPTALFSRHFFHPEYRDEVSVMNSWAKTIIVGVALLAGCEARSAAENSAGSGRQSGTGNRSAPDGTRSAAAPATPPGPVRRLRHAGRSRRSARPGSRRRRSSRASRAPSTTRRRATCWASTCSRPACWRPTRWAASISAPGRVQGRRPMSLAPRCMATPPPRRRCCPARRTTPPA